MKDRWYVLDDGPCDPPWNMAVDEALLVGGVEWGGPVLRWYDWTKPAATFGWFQRRNEVASWTDQSMLLRRPTAGGLVVHGEDWTYSLVFPPSHAWYRIRPTDSYCRLHHWLKDVLCDLGVSAELAPETDPSGPGQCFVGAERADLLVQGRKVAGAAQRRNRQGFLIQGSIQPVPFGVGRTDFLQALLRRAEQSWDVTWEPFPHHELLKSHAARLLETRHGQASYQAMR
jgi:lipoate-protein ligase A